MSRKRTLSASVDSRIYDELRSTAAEAGASQSAIVSRALQLYTSLSRASRQAFEDAVRAEGSEELKRFLRDLDRFLLLRRWEALADRIDQEVGDALARPVGEEELMRVAEEAVRETRDSRRSG